MVNIKNVNETNFRKNPLWKYEAKMRKEHQFSGVIYMYQHKTNGKIYIGQTINPYQRHKSHVNSINSDKELTTIFHNAIAKYGKDSFEYYVLKEIVEDDYESLKNSLDLHEKKYIKEYKSTNRKIGYNIKDGGTKIAFKKSTRNVPVWQYTLDGVLLKKFNTREEAARSVNGVSNVIKHACIANGTAYGYRWNTHENGVIIPEEKKVYQYTNDCKLIGVYSTLIEACEKTGISFVSISRAVIDKYRLAGGYYWRDEKVEEFPYSDFPNAVSQYDLEGNFITWYRSVNDAVKAINASGSTVICKAMKYKTAYHGCLWRKEKLDKINPFENRDIRTIVIEATFPDNTTKRYSSIKEASLDTNVNVANIRRSFEGKGTDSRGIKFTRIGKITNVFTND